MICKRLVIANNPYLPESYNPDEKNSYITYFDANNLYGYAMSQDLPVSDFKWGVSEKWDSYENCIVDVDLEIPKELHEKLKDFPLCPTHEDGKRMTTLYSKEKYICHSKYLKFCLEQGYILKRVNKVLTFTSKAWMKPYIEKNTALRMKATSDFEKDLWKLMNNAVYGKQIENVRNRVNIKATTELDPFVNKSNFKNIIELSGVSLIEMNKTSVTLNKPIYGGLAILDFSKILMSEFFYGYLKKKFGDRYQLLMTDTDSFMGYVECEDFYKEIQEDVHDWFDTSNYSKDSPLFSTKNKKIPGFFKDETAGVPISRFVGLRLKQYAYEIRDNNKVLKCKGITKSGMKSITFDDYMRALAGDIVSTSINIIRSHEHEIYTETIRNKALDKTDTKRIILADRIHTIPYGFEEV